MIKEIGKGTRQWEGCGGGGGGGVCGRIARGRGGGSEPSVWSATAKYLTRVSRKPPAGTKPRTPHHR